MRNRRTPKPETIDRENEVVKLRRGGLTWDLIAERAGYKSASSALAAYHRAAKRAVQEDVEQIRKIESERLDIAQSAIWGSVLSGNISAVTALIRIQERRAKLLGLDQPIRQQIEVTNYDGDTIDREVARLAEYLNSSQTYTLEPPTSES